MPVRVRERAAGGSLLVTALAVGVLCTAADYAESLSRMGGDRPRQWEPQVAMFCGKLNMVLDSETGQWEPDPFGTQSCLGTRDEILAYCVKVYPELKITGVTESSQPVRIENWCKKGKRKCSGRAHIVVPFRCLVDGFVSDALLVPDRCKFLHQQTMSTCQNRIHWHSVAKEACTAETLELHSYGMLLGCGEELFRGVEYVCCPSRFQGAGFEDVMAPVSMGEEDEGDQDNSQPQDRSQEEQDSPKPELKEEDQGVVYQADSKHWNDYRDMAYHEAEFYDEAVTETTTAEGIRGSPSPEPTYFRKREVVEHANYLDNLAQLDARRNERINEVMKEWAAADRRLLLVQKPDRISLNKHFQEVLATVQEQFSQERLRLVDEHISRMTGLINDERQWALEQYLQELQEEQPEANRVYQAVVRYIRAEGKDRKLTIRNYRRTLLEDPEKARQMKFQVLTHVRVIEERMNQTVSLLFKFPDLALMLGRSVLEAVQEHSLHSREQETLTELAASVSEGEREGVPRPIDPTLSTQRVLAVTHPQVRVGTTTETQSTHKQGFGLVDYSDTVVTQSYEEQRFITEYEDMLEDSVEVIYNSKETSGIQRDELEPESKVRLNKGTVISLLLIAVTIAMIVVLSIFMVRRKPYGTISHGIIEVDPMLSPEERQLSKMQNHGYENPSYKFFEQLQN
ncbi:amyloid beta precursor like protein 2 [Stegostoma tigrinum]|uniref:amyloid beta precursor like protein 2 n=1 Tax=Stegostoma tigrinum TaxID=3053191 RepID=UPI0028709A4E|nr:amyloid beta precursor like protein 2 [Stegostoma tigrinum]